MSNLLTLDNIHRTYIQGDEKLEVLKGASLTIMPGELVALVGPSGSGKSTLLNSVGLLERPDEGSIMLEGDETTKLPDHARTRLRRESIGFIYQFHHLLPEFTALENVSLPQLVLGTSKKQAQQTATDLLGRVGLSHRLDHRPAKLSGGEQQRVAIARALANSPKLLVADEPTGNLDEKTSGEVFALLKDMLKETGLGALIATHNMDLAARMDRTVSLHEGVLC